MPYVIQPGAKFKIPWPVYRLHNKWYYCTQDWSRGLGPFDSFEAAKSALFNSELHQSYLTGKNLFP